jgi:hypothetical protein
MDSSAGHTYNCSMDTSTTKIENNILDMNSMKKSDSRNAQMDLQAAP